MAVLIEKTVLMDAAAIRRALTRISLIFDITVSYSCVS